MGGKDTRINRTMPRDQGHMGLGANDVLWASRGSAGITLHSRVGSGNLLYLQQKPRATDPELPG